MSWQRLEQAWRGGWKPPEKLKPSEWAERYMKLPRSMSAEAGSFKMARTPYLAGIVDAVCEPGVEEIVFVKPTQVGGTTAQEILLGYWIDNDPGPCLIVKPSEAAVEECVKERIRPLLDGVPALRQHLSPRPHDNTLSSTKLDTMPLYFGWAGSPQSLASRPCRYVLSDEVDKYPPFAGREADPLSLAAERTATYLHRKRIFKTSTPTTRDGAIWRAWEACGDHRHHFVPCPHCGEYQQLAWPQVKWPKLAEPDKIKRADEIERGRMAWYECFACKGRIEESHKPRMLEAGVWASAGQTVDRDGALRGERPVSKRVGFHLSSLYSPWRKLWEMAAEWIRADGDIALAMNFRNSRLAEPFEQQVSRREPSRIREKMEAAGAMGIAGKPRVAPAWTVLIIATADVQKDHCYWQVDAWGYELRSKRLAVGIAATLDEVYRQVFSPAVAFVGEDGVPVGVSELIVDDGYRKDEVTEFARRDPRRVRMAKGLSTYFGPIAELKIEKASGVMVWNINTMQSKDTLDRLIGDPDPMRWQVHGEIGDEYCAQLTSEHKIIDPQSKQMRWEKKTSGAANHWWDCYSEDMEVLTADGWKFFPGVTQADKLATVNLGTDLIEFQSPTRLIAKRHIGDAVQIGGGERCRLDLLVTPTHRVVVYEGQSGRGPVVKLAKDLTIWDKIKTRAKWNGWDVEAIKLPATKKQPARVVDAEDFARFMGWYVAEGYCDCTLQKPRRTAKMFRVAICQSGGVKRDRIRELLGRLPWTFHEDEKTFVLSNEQLYNAVAGLGNKYTKRVPAWIKQASPRIINAFIEEAVLGDGWNDRTHQAYATVSPMLAGDFQELYLKAGFGTSIVTRKPKAYTLRGRSGTNTKEQYHVHRIARKWAHLRDGHNTPNFRTVQYDGMVYCATVPNGTLIVRRNGKVAICGNCSAMSCAVASGMGASNPAPLPAATPTPSRQGSNRNPLDYRGKW